MKVTEKERSAKPKATVPKAGQRSGFFSGPHAVGPLAPGPSVLSGRTSAPCPRPGLSQAHLGEHRPARPSLGRRQLVLTART